MPPPNVRNTGNRRQKMICKVFLWLGLALSAYQVLWTYWLAGVGIPDYEVDKTTGQKRIRRKPDQLVKHDHVLGKDVPNSPLDGIMEGYLTLTNIVIPKEGLVTSADQMYTNVKGQFCSITWAVQQSDPSKVPMFKDLRDASPLCAGTSYTVDLWDISRKATDYDHRNYTFAATPPRPGQGPVPPTAVVFHETRCGSTLIANLLAAFAPQHVRVYSESPPPVTALKACEFDRHCDEGSQKALIQDVFYLMGRVTRPQRPQYVFYKIQSVGVHHIQAFTEAMPSTPWVFAYRDSVEVMMSHFKNYQRGNPLSEDFMPVCLRNYGRKHQNPVLKRLVAAESTSVEELTKEEYCAAHLASLAQSAVDEHERTADSSTPRWFVNYNELPYRIWEGILPRLVNGMGPMDHAMIDRMKKVAHKYSKGRDSRAGEVWHEDSTLKQGKAPDMVKKAAARYLEPVFAKMEKIKEAKLFD